MEPHEEGRAAAAAGLDITACPYRAFSNGAAGWQRGWARVTGAHPLDLTRRRVAVVQDRDAALQSAEPRPLDEWPEPLRSLIAARLRSPRYTSPGRCRWCHGGVEVPGTSPLVVRAYKSDGALARHEGRCRYNPDASVYAGGGGFTVGRDGRMAAWYSSPGALDDMREDSRHHRQI